MSVGVDATGRVWLHDRRGVLLVYSASGATLATVRLVGGRVGGPQRMVVTAEGIAYVLGTESADSFVAGMVPYDLNGVAGEMVELPDFLGDAYLSAGMRFIGVPFFAYADSMVTPRRARLVAAANEYSFRLEHPDGSVTQVKRTSERIPVLAEEAEAHRHGVIRFLREADPTWTWPNTDMPEHKPPFNQLLPTHTGEIWALRSGRASPRNDCDPGTFPVDVNDLAPCWDEDRIVDVFAADGRYLGRLDLPTTISFEPPPFVAGDTVIARVEDAAGTIRVKRFRLVPPGTPGL